MWRSVADTDCNSDRNGSSDCNCYADSHANTDGNADSSSNSHCYCDRNGYAHGNINPLYEVYTDAEASANSAGKAVGMVISDR